MGFAVWLTGFVAEGERGLVRILGPDRFDRTALHELNGRKVPAVARVLAIALMVGASGYLLGSKGSATMSTRPGSRASSRPQSRRHRRGDQGYAAEFQGP